MTRAITTSDGFRVEFNPRGGLNYFKNGEPYPAPGQKFEPPQIIESLVKEIERLHGGGQAAPKWEVGKDGWDTSDEITREDI